MLTIVRVVGEEAGLEFAHLVEGVDLLSFLEVKGFSVFTLRSSSDDHFLVRLQVLAVLDRDLVFYYRVRVFPVEVVHAFHCSEVPVLDASSQLV
jgi:hypothetical protein